MDIVNSLKLVALRNMVYKYKANGAIFIASVFGQSHPSSQDFQWKIHPHFRQWGTVSQYLGPINGASGSRFALHLDSPPDDSVELCGQNEECFARSVSCRWCVGDIVELSISFVFWSWGSTVWVFSWSLFDYLKAKNQALVWFFSWTKSFIFIMYIEDRRSKTMIYNRQRETWFLNAKTYTKADEMAEA